MIKLSYGEMMARLLYLLLLIYAPLLESVESLTFDTLTEVSSLSPNELESSLISYLDQEVQIRGFIYRNDQDEFVLSSRPHLASCCQMKEEYIPHQIYLDTPQIDAPAGKTVSVQGFFTLSPIKNREGKLIKLYSLKNPKITTIENKTTWSLLAALIIIGSFVVWGLRRKKEA